MTATTTNHEPCTGTPDCPICAEACEHRKHVGNTCTYECGICRADHEDTHLLECSYGTYRPQYTDCQFCEAMWYNAQQQYG